MPQYTHALQKGADKAELVSLHRFERARRSAAWFGARITKVYGLTVLVHSDVQAIHSDTIRTAHADAVQDGQDKRKRPNGKKKAQKHLKPHSHVGKAAQMTKTECTPRSGLHYERKRA